MRRLKSMLALWPFLIGGYLVLLVAVVILVSWYQHGFLGGH